MNEGNSPRSRLDKSLQGYWCSVRWSLSQVKMQLEQLAAPLKWATPLGTTLHQVQCIQDRTAQRMRKELLLSPIRSRFAKYPAAELHQATCLSLAVQDSRTFR